MKLSKSLFKLHGVFLVALLSVSVVSHCWADKSNTSLKIGVVKSADLEGSAYFKNVQEKLHKEFAARKERYFTRAQELQSKVDLFKRDRAILSEKERLSKDRELTKLSQEVNHIKETLETEIESRQQEELVNFQKVVNEAVSKVAKKDGYDLILVDQVVLYNSVDADCTKQVLAMLSNQ